MTPTISSKKVDVQVFTSNGTWTKPPGALWCDILLIGGGGGGGSGRRGASGSDRTGGAGGQGGGVTHVLVPASFLGSTEAVTRGSGGSGGGAPLGSNQNGAAGVDGGSSSIAGFIAEGGKGGPGGVNAATGTAASGKGRGTIHGTAVVSQASAQPVNGEVTAVTDPVGERFGRCGGAGGGMDATDTGHVGNNGGAYDGTLVPAVAGGTFGDGSGPVAAGPGGSGASRYWGGGGGGGGYSLAAGSSGAGAAGGLYGGGGGGAGASQNSVGTAGAGGAGANGVAVIVTHCAP